jgi:polyisoprenoid-binding protein YceI
MIKQILFLVPVAALLSGVVHAAPIDPSKSSVSSTGKQLGVAVTGKFKKVSGDVTFNPAQLAKSTANLVIDIASYDMGLPEYNKNILTTEWFDAAKFPKATFVSSSIKGSAGQYTVTGKFTLKGKVQNIAFPVQFKQVGATQVFDGAFVVKRTAFGVGSGDWADTSVVADDVKVQFHLVVPVSK